MVKTTHIRIRNVGLIFELISHSIIHHLMKNKDPNPFIKICKEHFKHDSLISKEYGAYKVLTESKCSNLNQAISLLNETVSYVKDINEKELEKECQRLLGSVNKVIPIKEFFKQPIKNYRVFASIQQYLCESRYPSGIEVLPYKKKLESVIIDHLIENKVNVSMAKRLHEIRKNRIDDLTYLVMIEQFNYRYKDLLPQQKNIINNYMISMNNKKDFEVFMRKEALSLKKKLEELASLLSEEPRANIKLRLINAKLKKIIKENKVVNHDNVLLLLKSHNLLEKIRNLKNET